MSLIKFIASNFIGYNGKDIFVHVDFVPLLLTMNDIAVKHHMQVIVISSHRWDTNVKGAIVPPAEKSNHLIGHAIDFNIKNLKTGEYYNSVKLADDKGADELFMNEVVEKSGLYWGDKFTRKDSVHVDSRINKKNPKLWDELYVEIQKQKPKDE